MSKLIHDLKGLKNLMIIVPILYYALLLSSIIFADADRPRTIFYYNEMAFLPLIVMLTVVYFQHELGGRMMEIYSTFPLSFAQMLIRKLGLIVMTTLIVHLGWVLVYKLKFDSFNCTIYYYSGNAPQFTEISWFQLWIQAFPEYLMMIGITMLFMILTKRLYGGLAAGFTLWMIEVLLNGQIASSVSLFTNHLPEEVPFIMNRLLLLGLFVLCMMISIMLMNRRERWVIQQETE